MSITIVTSRELNHDIGKAKRAAKEGAVVITDRGKPAHVLLTYDDYQKLTGRKRSIAEALSMPGLSDIDFDPPKSNLTLKPATL